jgi:hypothetical protein
MVYGTAFVSKAYLAATMAYGASRKLAITHDAQYRRTVYDTATNTYVPHTYPMLVADRAFVCGMGALSSIYLWPIYAYKDLQHAEIYARGLDKNEYFRDTRLDVGLIDYLVA